MRAVLPTADADGRPRLGDVAEPSPGAGEVLVRVRSTAINRADLLQIRGLYPPPPGETEVPGLELAGEIAGLGPGVEGWSEGARVMALVAGGGHAEWAVAPAGQLMPVPRELGFDEAASLPEAALTAWTNLVVEAGLRSGERVLVSGATGGVGSFAVQLACELGAEVVAAGRERERLARVAADVRVVDDDGLEEEVRRATGGHGVDVVLELVGGERVGPHLVILRPGGRLVLVGILAGPKAEIDLGHVLRRRLRIVGSLLRPRPREEKAELVAGFWKFAGPRLADGRLAPVIDRVVPFESIADAYAAVAGGGLVGKVVVEVAGG